MDIPVERVVGCGKSMTRPIAKGSRDNGSMIFCANPACEKFIGMGVHMTTTVDDEKYQVCGFNCADALKKYLAERAEGKRE